jgi:hypothetical protein
LPIRKKSADSPVSSATPAAFDALRDVLRAHGGGLRVSADSSDRFCLDGQPGPATIAAWRGQLRRPTLPVAWVERRTSYVGFHLMGLDGSAALIEGLSSSLRARMHGKTCFNFTDVDAVLLAELDRVTAASIAGLRRGGFVI